MKRLVKSTYTEVEIITCKCCANKNFVFLMIKPKDNVEKEYFQGFDEKLKSDLYEVVNQYDEMF
jgi:hypothetical protein